MTHYRTCRTCLFNSANCELKSQLSRAIRGLGITSVKHKCAAYRDEFTPGQPIVALTTPYMGSETMGHFPGWFIRYRANASPLVYIKPGTKAVEDESVLFETQGKGYCGIAMNRIATRNTSEPSPYCSECDTVFWAEDGCRNWEPWVMKEIGAECPMMGKRK